MLPRMVVRVRRAVRRLAQRSEVPQTSGAEIEADWHKMLSLVDERDREIERRLAAAERALNRLDAI